MQDSKDLQESIHMLHFGIQIISKRSFLSQKKFKMTREQALKLLHDNVQNQNLRRHCYAVEAVMRALYKRLEGGGSSYSKASEDKWGMAGLLHDADYELTKETAKTEH